MATPSSTKKRRSAPRLPRSSTSSSSDSESSGSGSYSVDQGASGASADSGGAFRARASVDRLRPDGKVGLGARAEPSGAGPASEDADYHPSTGARGSRSTHSGAALAPTNSYAVRARDHSRQIGNVILLVGATLFIVLCILILGGVTLYKANNTDGHVEELRSALVAEDGTAVAAGGAAGATSSGTAAATVAAATRFRVLVGDDFAPWDTLSASGENVGLNTRIIEAACAAASVTCDIVTAPYGECFTTDAATGAAITAPALAAGTHDGCAGWATTVSRAQMAQLSDTWAAAVGHRFIARSGTTSVPASLATTKVGFASGFAGSPACLARLGFDFNSANAVFFASEALVASAVVSGTVDMGLVFENFAAMPTGATFVGSSLSCSGGLALASRKGSEMTNTINRGLQLIRESGQLATICGTFLSDRAPRGGDLFFGRGIALSMQ
jgi:hypothetical protein